jgi:hypothetical protein
MILLSHYIQSWLTGERPGQKQEWKKQIRH